LGDFMTTMHAIWVTLWQQCMRFGWLFYYSSVERSILLLY